MKTFYADPETEMIKKMCENEYLADMPVGISNFENFILKQTQARTGKRIFFPHQEKKST